MAHTDCRPTLTRHALAAEKARHRGTAACSAGNRGQGFRPAFLDTATGRHYLSAFADGRPAPVHLLDGLPESLVLARSDGRVVAARRGVVSGFVRGGRFYTREQALGASAQETGARVLASGGPPAAAAPSLDGYLPRAA